MTDLSEARNLPATLSVTLSFTDEIRQKLREGEGALAVAEAYEIDSPDMAQVAADELTTVKGAIVKIEELRKGFLEPAKKIIDNANALFNPALDGYRAAESTLKQRLAGWSEREKQRIALENARREEEARKARQEAEAKAAAERARAEQQAAEERRKAEEAEARRKQAEAEGNARAAAAAAAEVAKAQERAAAAVENGEAKAVEAHLSAAASVVEAAPVVQAKIAGVQMRDNWSAELRSGTTPDQAKILIVQEAAAGRMDLLGIIEINESALNKLAKALKTNFNVPGYAAKNTPIVAGSRK